MTAAPPHAEDLAAHVERLVIGADYGADGYTTLAQADDLADRLRLRPGLRLLELGSGRGWPGLHLAQTTGCHVTLTDLPVDGLRDARRRAAEEGIVERCDVLAADGAALPFATDTFDAIVHADVLCCLRAKLSVLKASRRVLRPRGRLAFTTIHIATGLPRPQRRRAARAGPPAVATSSTYPRLLRSAGFVEIDHVDLTAAYLDTLRAWVDHAERFEDQLGRAALPLAFAEKLDRRRGARAAIEAGLLHRSLFVARVSGASTRRMARRPDRPVTK